MAGDTALATVDTSAAATTGADASSTSTALTTTTGTELATTEDAGAGGGEEGGELTTGDASPGRSLENGKPSQTTRDSLDLIKQTNPKLAHAIPRALAIEQRLRSEFPGVNPFDAIKAMRRELKALGGEEGIAQIRQSLADMEEMDLLYAAGDPRMLDKMTATPEGKAAFTKLAQHAFSLYEKLAPKAFTKYMASVIVGDLVGQRVDMSLARLAELTPKENTAALAELEKLDAYMKRLAKFEQLEPEAVATAAANPDRDKLEQERKELAREKRELAIQGWKTAADSDKTRIFDQAWAQETKGRKVSEIEKEDIQARFWTRLPIALKQIPGFSDTLKEFFENDDRNGYVGYLRSLHTEKIPALLRTEINRRLGAPARTAAATTTTATATTTTAKTQVDAGFKRIATRPEMNTVNNRVTTPLMWMKKQAVLKSGEKVQWG